MTNEQIREAERIIPLLQEARQHLDNARFRMGLVENTDPQYVKCAKAYEYICKALDEF